MTGAGLSAFPATAASNRTTSIRRGTSSPRAIGARVIVHTASGSQTQEVRLGTGYLSQGPATLHFGLGPHDMASAVEVRWPGPGRQVSRLEIVRADRRLTIRQPQPEGVLLSVVRGSGGGLHAEGAAVPVEAEAAHGHYRFSHWSSEGGGVFADARSARTTFTIPASTVTVFANFLPGPPLSDSDVSVARRWIEVLLQAIREDFARPTVHARNLFHLSAAMRAWAGSLPRTGGRTSDRHSSPALCRLRVGPFDLFPCGGGGAGGPDRRSLLSRRHERVLHPRQPVPRVRAGAIGRHDPASGPPTGTRRTSAACRASGGVSTRRRTTSPAV